MENKQTSIEWLFHKLWNEPKDKMVWYALLKISKQMHKDEIAQAFEVGYENGACVNEGESIYHGTNYYNEIYERKTTESK